MKLRVPPIIVVATFLTQSIVDGLNPQLWFSTTPPTPAALRNQGVEVAVTPVEGGLHFDIDVDTRALFTKFRANASEIGALKKRDYKRGVVVYYRPVGDQLKASFSVPYEDLAEYVFEIQGFTGGISNGYYILDLRLIGSDESFVDADRVEEYLAREFKDARPNDNADKIENAVAEALEDEGYVEWRRWKARLEGELVEDGAAQPAAAPESKLKGKE